MTRRSKYGISKLAAAQRLWRHMIISLPAYRKDLRLVSVDIYAYSRACLVGIATSVQWWQRAAWIRQSKSGNADNRKKPEKKKIIMPRYSNFSLFFFFFFITRDGNKRNSYNVCVSWWMYSFFSLFLSFARLGKNYLFFSSSVQPFSPSLNDEILLIYHVCFPIFLYLSPTPNPTSS